MDFEIHSWKDVLQHPRLRLEVVLLTIATEHRKGGKQNLSPRQRYTREERGSSQC